MYKRNYVATALLLILDFAWLTWFMGEKYRQMIPKIQKESMQANMQYAIIAYAFMVMGLNMFVLPNVRKGYELEDSLKYGFTFGVIVYGVFDFTNATVLKDWDIRLALVDVIWGGAVYFLSSYLATRFTVKH